MKICEKCGSERNVIRHHEKYKEIHGYDKVIMLCMACHGRIHRGVRSTGACEVPPYLLQQYSRRAYNETIEKEKELKKYKSSFLKTIDFDEEMNGINLIERITYDENMGNTRISSFFEKTFCKRIVFIDL